MRDIERFSKSLSQIAKQPVSGQDASEAFQNLNGFMNLLIKINEREKIVSGDELSS